MADPTMRLSSAKGLIIQIGHVVRGEAAEQEARLTECVITSFMVVKGCGYICLIPSWLCWTFCALVIVGYLTLPYLTFSYLSQPRYDRIHQLGQRFKYNIDI